MSHAIVVFNLHPRAKKDFAFLLRGVIDDFEIFHAFSEIAHATVDFTQALFIILIVSISLRSPRLAAQVTFFVTSGRSSRQR